MTSIIEAYDRVLDHFIDEWGDETPIALPNQLFELDGIHEFVRINIKPMTGDYVSIGSTQYGNRWIRQYGNIVIQVFTLSGTGLKRSNELCQIATDILNKEIYGVELLNPSVRDFGDDNEGYYQKHVIFEYNYDFMG